jgi:methylmalonyl-CoA carboxyltransferase large subunit
MTTEAANWTQLTEALDGLRRDLARLSERVAALEKAAGLDSPAVAPAPAAVSAAPAAAPEGLTEELLVVISAAVAAFLGKKAPIRQIRLLGSAAWAQQGRVSIQASHSLSVHHR